MTQSKTGNDQPLVVWLSMVCLVLSTVVALLSYRLGRQDAESGIRELERDQRQGAYSTYADLVEEYLVTYQAPTHPRDPSYEIRRLKHIRSIWAAGRVVGRYGSAAAVTAIAAINVAMSAQLSTVDRPGLYQANHIDISDLYDDLTALMCLELRPRTGEATAAACRLAQEKEWPPWP